MSSSKRKITVDKGGGDHHGRDHHGGGGGHHHQRSSSGNPGSSSSSGGTKRASVFSRLGTKGGGAGGQQQQSSGKSFGNKGSSSSSSSRSNHPPPPPPPSASSSKRSGGDRKKKRVAPGVSSSSSSRTKASANSPAIDPDWENWDEKNLDYDDELMLEKKRQLLQRELAKQMQQEGGSKAPSASASTAGRVHPKQLQQRQRKSSSSSSSSSLSSSDSDSDSSDSSNDEEEEDEATVEAEHARREPSRKISSKGSKPSDTGKRRPKTSTQVSRRSSGDRRKASRDKTREKVSSIRKRPLVEKSRQSSKGREAGNRKKRKKEQRRSSRGGAKSNSPDRQIKTPAQKLSSSSSSMAVSAQPMKQERDKFGFYCAPVTSIATAAEWRSHKKSSSSGSRRKGSGSLSQPPSKAKSSKAASKSHESSGKRSESGDRRNVSPGKRQRSRSPHGHRKGTESSSRRSHTPNTRKVRLGDTFADNRSRRHESGRGRERGRSRDNEVGSGKRGGGEDRSRREETSRSGRDKERMSGGRPTSGEPPHPKRREDSRERREDRSQLQSSRGHSRDRRGGSADRRHKSLDRQERGGRGSLDRQERDRGGSRERLDRGGDRGSLERQDRISARTSLERGLDRRSAERGDSFGGQSSRTLLPPQEHRDGSGEKSSSMLSSQMTVRDRERGYEDRGRDYEFGRSSDLRRDGGPSDRQQARFDDPHGSHREQGQSSGRGRESWGGDDFDRRGSHSGRYERTGPRSKDGAVDWGTGGSDYPPDWGSSGQHYRRERSGSERSGRGFGRGAHLTGSNSVRIEQRDQFEWRGGLGGGRRTPPQFRIGGLGGYSPQLPPRRRSRSGERLLPPEALQRGGPPPPSMSGGDRRSSRERSPRRVDQQLPERLPREKQQQGPLVAKGDDEISKDEGNVTDREKEMTSKTAKEEGEVTDEQQQTTSEAVGQQNLPHKRTKLDEVDANKGEKKENGEAKEEGEEDDDEGEEQPIAGDQFSDIESDEELKEPTATAASTTTAPAVAGGADSAGAEPEEGETVSRPQSRRSSNQDSAENKVGEKEGEKGDLLEGISDEDLDVSDEDEGRMSMEKKMVDALEVDWSQLMVKPEEKPATKGALKKQWSLLSLLKNVGISKDLLGEDTYRKVIEKANEEAEDEEKFQPLDPIAGLDVLKRKRLERRKKLFSDFGPYTRALNSRTDKAIRRELIGKDFVTKTYPPKPKMDSKWFQDAQKLLQDAMLKRQEAESALDRG